MLAVAAVVGGVITNGAGAARAIPEYTDPNLVTTLRCDSANPLPGPTIPIHVDVFNQIPFPADGLPGPAISLIASNRAQPAILDYTIEVRVSWRNLASGRSGTVTVPTRARTVTWQVDLHPGPGPVAFTIRQKIGVMAFVPMVGATTSTCAGRATA
ncbi:MAG: hypothetical protein CME34_19875 [Gordonia sp.]|uniref:hypothetical protein n=1 Tax=Gordonia sp. (in: high G+C Gram-positive bacteria) TaxID=84139 RepID=UPI000C6775BD|nr:hypothetical protein [Gordonia sp. (in: high G+C Gram-positive bacteria)]MAU84080.1 hypothetical protein [Gordonia sp. (in: high G+C Gram-positive bacteria)]